MMRRVVPFTLAVAWLSQAACNSPTADRERRMAEIRVIEARNHAMGGTGCKVCPSWCEMFDLYPLPTMQIMTEYRRAALIVVYDNDGDAWRQVERLACMVAIAGPSAQEVFLHFLADPAREVRYAAAVHAIEHKFAIERGLATLRLLAVGADESEDILKLSAHIQLQNWDAEIPVEL